MMTVGFPPSVSPGLDEQGYPTKGFLQKIESFRPQEAKGWALLMDVVREAWTYQEWGWAQEVDNNLCGRPVMLYKISTAGWSGNEDLIRARHANTLFWTMCWVQSRRGGHYLFITEIQSVTAL